MTVKASGLPTITLELWIVYAWLALFAVSWFIDRRQWQQSAMRSYYVGLANGLTAKTVDVTPDPPKPRKKKAPRGTDH